MCSKEYDLASSCGTYLPKESALLDKLILEITDNSEAQTVIDLISSREWFNELETSQNTFKIHWDERREQLANKQENKSELRVKTYFNL